MRKLQRGFSIVTAIFLLVVLEGLGAAMLTFFNAQHQSSALDVLGSRAYQAARTGVEWAAYQVVTSSSSSVTAATCATTFAQGSLGGTLAPFTVKVNCLPASYVEGASTVWIYDVSAVACTDTTCPATTTSASYVERVISTKMGK
jgi:MSHA biogenesis protein MshP